MVAKPSLTGERGATAAGRTRGLACGPWQRYETGLHLLVPQRPIRFDPQVCLRCLGEGGLDLAGLQVPYVELSVEVLMDRSIGARGLAIKHLCSVDGQSMAEGAHHADYRSGLVVVELNFETVVWQTTQGVAAAESHARHNRIRVHQHGKVVAA